MTASVAKWQVPPWAWVPILLAIGAEAVSNALRAYGLGAHLDRFTVVIQGSTVSLAGAVLVLAAVAVSLSQARAAWVALTPMAPTWQRVVAALAATLLLAISVIAMASHILEAERAKLANDGGARGAYDRAKTAYDKGADELKRLEGANTIAEVRAAMDAAPVPRNVFLRTKECTEVTRQKSFELCKPLLDLRQEMARAIRKRELEAEVPRLKTELDHQQRPEEAEVSHAGDRRGRWAWIMGAGVVFVATFGTVIWSRAETVPPATANDNETRVSNRGSAGSIGFHRGTARLGREFRRFHGRNPQIPELQRAFPGTPKTTAWRHCKAA